MTGTGHASPEAGFSPFFRAGGYKLFQCRGGVGGHAACQIRRGAHEAGAHIPRDAAVTHDGRFDLLNTVQIAVALIRRILGNGGNSLDGSRRIELILARHEAQELQRIVAVAAILVYGKAVPQLNVL